MTRINLTDPKTLTDQHLFTEYRELPRIFSNVRNAQAKGKTPKDFKIPMEFVLGTGHMTFFYNKLEYLVYRYSLIVQECRFRGINISNTDMEFTKGLAKHWFNNYQPPVYSIEVSQQRLDEKILMKPNWYKWHGCSLTELDEQPCCTSLDSYKGFD